MFACEQERLDAWLSIQRTALEVDLPDELPFDFAPAYTRSSFEALEVILLEMFAAKEDLKLPENMETVDRLVRYVGETLIENFEGCFWRVGTDLYEGIPVVSIPDDSAVPESPFAVINTVVKRRTGVELTGLFDGIAKRVPSRTTLLPDLSVRYETLKTGSGPQT